MNYESFHLYEVVGDPQFQVIADFEKRRHEAHQAVRSFMQTHKLSDVVGDGDRYSGVLFPKDAFIPKQWRKVQDRGRWGGEFYVPNRASREGKKIAVELESLQFLSAKQLAKELGGSMFVVGAPAESGGNHILNAQCGQFGDRWVFLEPKRSGKEAPVFPGCKLLKLSEFHAIKEAAQPEAA